MADDARISTALPRHPKTVKLQRRLGAQGCWSLLCLFLWVADNRPEGKLEGMSAEDIEIAANWPGDVGEFVRTLVEVRFLDGKDGTYAIHDWPEHNPWAASRPFRIEKARAAASVRWGSKRVATGQNATSMQGACDEHETAMPSSPLLSSPPDTTVESTSELYSSDHMDPKRSPRKRKAEPSDRAVRLAQKLHDEIVESKPDFRFSDCWLESWARTADLMMARDGRSFEQILTLIGWVQGDTFWKVNILSMGKLREQFDRLEMAARSRHEGKTTHGNGKPGIAEVIERECAIARARAQ